MHRLLVHSDQCAQPEIDATTAGYVIIYMGARGETVIHGEADAKVLPQLLGPLTDKLTKEVLGKVDLNALIQKFISAKFGGGK